MTGKERIELKLQILNDIKNCISFNFMTVGCIDINKLEDTIQSYENSWDELNGNKD